MIEDDPPKRRRWLQFRLGTLLIAVLVLSLPLSLFAVRKQWVDKRSEEANQAAEKIRQAIRKEIKTLGNHAWAGEYYFGDGLGVNVSLILAPASGYVFEWHGCLGLYDRNYGTVTWHNGRIRLSFTFPNEQKGFVGIAEEFIPVSWGDRQYLIPSDDIVGFCNSVNDGSEPRKGPH